MSDRKPCDRCHQPLIRHDEGWRHTTWAKRGQLCLHPRVTERDRRERGLRERYDTKGGWVV